jgi:hypothetical protein
MSTKYDVGGRARWAHSKGLPNPSDHTLDRWDERMPADARSPEHAIERSKGTGIADHDHWDHHDRRPDTIRVYHGRTRSGTYYGAVFVVVEGTILTCYRIADVDYAPVRAYLHALAQAAGWEVTDE